MMDLLWTTNLRTYEANSVIFVSSLDISIDAVRETLETWAIDQPGAMNLNLIYLLLTNLLVIWISVHDTPVLII